jgi:hypothetical protein
MSEQDPAVDGWEQALGELEQHVGMAERMIRDRLVSEPLDWQAPEELGPMPDEFVFRARQLLRRQQALIDAIPGILASTSDQRKVLGRISDATGRSPLPLYIDLAT